MPARQTTVPWKQKILQADKLRGKSMEMLYDRVRLLVEVFEDDAFWNENQFRDDEDAAAHLDAHVDEFRTIGSASPFWTLKACLERWPQKKEWADKSVWEMARTLHEERGQANGQEHSRKPVKRATVKELTEAEKRAEYAETTANKLQSEAAKVLSEKEQLAVRVRELEEENAILRGRIAELERITARQLLEA